MEELLEPVIELAEKGVVVTAKQAERLGQYRELIVQVSGATTLFATPFKEGDTIRYPALAHTFRQIQKMVGMNSIKEKQLKNLPNFYRKKVDILQKKTWHLMKPNGEHQLVFPTKTYELFQCHLPVVVE